METLRFEPIPKEERRRFPPPPFEAGQKTLRGEILPPRRWAEDEEERMRVIRVELHNYIIQAEEKQPVIIVNQPKPEPEELEFEGIGDMLGYGIGKGLKYGVVGLGVGIYLVSGLIYQYRAEKARASAKSTSS